MDISSTTIPDSTQVNADDLIGVERDVTVTKVSAGTSEQPVNIELAEFPGRAYRPSKSMRRVLVACWGVEASEYVGRRMTLYRDPEVSFGREKVGGIKIKALSHIDKRMTIALTVSRGKRAPHTVEPLAAAPPPESLADRVSKAVAWFAAKGVVQSNLEAHVGRPVGEWVDGDLDSLTADRDAIVEASA